MQRSLAFSFAVLAAGDLAAVDVRVEFYPSGKIVTQAGVKADQTVEIRE